MQARRWRSVSPSPSRRGKGHAGTPRKNCALRPDDMMSTAKTFGQSARI